MKKNTNSSIDYPLRFVEEYDIVCLEALKFWKLYQTVMRQCSKRKHEIKEMIDDYSNLAMGEDYFLMKNGKN